MNEVNVKRKSIDFSKKIEIIAYYDNNYPAHTIEEISEVLKIPKSTLIDIIQNRNAVEELLNENISDKHRFRLRKSQHPLVDKCLYKWLCNVGDNPHIGMIINSETLQIAGNKFLHILGENGNITRGYIDRWKKRFNVKSYVVSGESSGSDVTSFKEWKSSTLIFIEKNFLPSNVINIDETGLK
jgi:hypothetical protein